jgi:hypothetical protein
MIHVSSLNFLSDSKKSNKITSQFPFYFIFGFRNTSVPIAFENILTSVRVGMKDSIALRLCFRATIERLPF